MRAQNGAGEQPHLRRLWFGRVSGLRGRCLLALGSDDHAAQRQQQTERNGRGCFWDGGSTKQRLTVEVHLVGESGLSCIFGPNWQASVASGRPE